MMVALDPNLVAFAAAVVERRGGTTEAQGDQVFSLLPEELSHALNLPEQVMLGSEEAPMLYGSPVLDRMIQVVTDDVPILYGKIEIGYLKKEGFDQLISQDFHLVGAQIKATARAETLNPYMTLECHYVALSDERKEGLIQVTVNEQNGAVVTGMENLWHLHPVHFVPEGKVPLQFVASPQRAVSQALRSAMTLAKAELAEFVTGMRRRLHRDAKNIREYYEALEKEMQASLAHPNLTEVQQNDRRSKIADLPRETDAKIQDLKKKYRVMVRVVARAAVRLLVPVVQVMTQVRCGKRVRSVSLVWNPLSRHFDPFPCEACGDGTRRIHAVESKSAIELRCPTCADRKHIGPYMTP
jgi:hypothetical protein